MIVLFFYWKKFHCKLRENEISRKGANLPAGRQGLIHKSPGHFAAWRVSAYLREKTVEWRKERTSECPKDSFGDTTGDEQRHRRWLHNFSRNGAKFASKLSIPKSFQST